MKKLSILFLFIAMGITAFAQDNNRFEEAMKKNLSMLDTAESMTSLQTLANNFERIASAKNDQWLPYYYAGICNIRLAFMQKNKDKIDDIADKVEKLEDKADKLNPNKAEMLCLRSMIASTRIQVDPRTRGMQYGSMSAQLLQQAQQTDPDNPRPYLLLGQNAFYTPAQWGGGKDKAKPLLEEALKKYEIFKPANDLAPNWGKAMAEYLLEQCNK